MSDLDLDIAGAVLPAGYSARPLSLEQDLDATYQVFAAAQQEDLGTIAIERADIVADWSRPSMDPSTDTVGVFRGDRLVAAAEVSRGATRAEAAVHPHARGAGIGTWLASWVEARAAATGSASIGQTVPLGSSGQRLLEARGGYRQSHTAWILVLPAGAAVPDRPLPEGYSIRSSETERDHRAAHDVIERAFGEWANRPREPYEEWVPGTVDRPGYAPWQLRVVEHDGTIVGACFTVVDELLCGYVDQLAVAREHRGRGLAQALLADGFRGAAEHGAVRSELATDSRTGALDLYLKVGMQVSEHVGEPRDGPAAPERGLGGQPGDGVDVLLPRLVLGHPHHRRPRVVLGPADGVGEAGAAARDVTIGGLLVQRVQAQLGVVARVLGEPGDRLDRCTELVLGSHAVTVRRGRCRGRAPRAGLP